MAVQTFFLIAGRMTNSSVFMVGRGSSHKAGPPTAPYSAKILKKKRSRFKSHASLLSKEWFTKVEPLMRPHTSMTFERCALYNLLGTEWNHAVFKFAAHIKEQFSVTLCRKSKSLIGDEDTFTKTTQGSAGALLGLTGLLFFTPPTVNFSFSSVSPPRHSDPVHPGAVWHRLNNFQLLWKVSAWQWQLQDVGSEADMHW